LGLASSFLGRVHYAQGRYSEADTRFQESETLLERAKGIGDPDLVPVLVNRAYTLWQMGETNRAISTGVRAASILANQADFGLKKKAGKRQKKRILTHETTD